MIKYWHAELFTYSLPVCTFIICCFTFMFCCKFFGNKLLSTIYQIIWPRFSAVHPLCHGKLLVTATWSCRTVANSSRSTSRAGTIVTSSTSVRFHTLPRIRLHRSCMLLFCQRWLHLHDKTTDRYRLVFVKIAYLWWFDKHQNCAYSLQHFTIILFQFDALNNWGTCTIQAMPKTREVVHHFIRAHFDHWAA